MAIEARRFIELRGDRGRSAIFGVMASMPPSRRSFCQRRRARGDVGAVPRLARKIFGRAPLLLSGCPICRAPAPSSGASSRSASAARNLISPRIWDASRPFRVHHHSGSGRFTSSEIRWRRSCTSRDSWHVGVTQAARGGGPCAGSRSLRSREDAPGLFSISWTATTPPHSGCVQRLNAPEPSAGSGYFRQLDSSSNTTGCCAPRACRSSGQAVAPACGAAR